MKKVYVVLDESKQGHEAVIKVFGSQIKAKHFLDDQPKPNQLVIFCFTIEKRFV